MKTNSKLKAMILVFILCILAVHRTAYTGQRDCKLSPTLNSQKLNNELFSRIYGCEAAGAIANSMGDVTEGLSWRQIEERYGFVDKLLAQDKKGSRRPQRFGPDWVRYAHHRPPGMTEDGFERHRLCTSAILKKRGRITIEDLARTWIEDIDPNKFGYLLGPQDQVIYNLLKTGLRKSDVMRRGQVLLVQAR
jgi:ADP-ribosylglycohydrolase